MIKLRLKETKSMINERKFLKQINQKSNKDGDLTYNYVCELLDYNSKQLVNKVSIFDRIIFYHI